jgi:hypothetical protein
VETPLWLVDTIRGEPARAWSRPPEPAAHADQIAFASLMITSL